MKGIFSILVENKDGVLSQIAGLFSRRGFNIDSLAVGETDKHDVSSITIVSTADARTIDQIEKHLNKKMDVIKVRRLDEVNNTPDVVAEFLDLLRSFGILEVQRTGTISMAKS